MLYTLQKIQEGLKNNKTPEYLLVILCDESQFAALQANIENHIAHHIELLLVQYEEYTTFINTLPIDFSTRQKYVPLVKGHILAKSTYTLHYLMNGIPLVYMSDADFQQSVDEPSFFKNVMKGIAQKIRGYTDKKSKSLVLDIEMYIQTLR